MYEADIAHLEVGERRLRQLLHLVQGHGFIGFVVEIDCAASTSVVADDPFKNRRGSILRSLKRIGNLLDSNLLAHDGTMLRLEPHVRSGWSNRALSSTHRGQQANFVVLAKHCRSNGILLVDGAGDGPCQRLEAGEFLCVVRYHGGKAGAWLQVQAFFLPPNDVLKLTKKQHPNTHEVSSSRIPDSELNVLRDFLSFVNEEARKHSTTADGGALVELRTLNDSTWSTEPYSTRAPGFRRPVALPGVSWARHDQGLLQWLSRSGLQCLPPVLRSGLPPHSSGCLQARARFLLRSAWLPGIFP